MKKWLNFYFDLSKREFNGLLLLAGLILLIAALPYGYRMLLVQHDDDRAGLEAAARFLEADLKEIPDHNKKTWPFRERKERSPLFAFDPNTASAEDWEMLGLSRKQSAAILKYVSKGGRFRKKEDLQKMYTISPRTYEKLAPYVQIRPAPPALPAAVHYPSVMKPAAGKPAVVLMEINGADSAMLCRVRGIGPAFARRIIRYRERIGGFHQKPQLMEVFGLDSVKYAEIESQITVDAAGLKKININTATKEDFKNHPYLRYKQINALIEYRKQHGNYSNIAELNKVLVLDAVTISRIAPYLTF